MQALMIRVKRVFLPAEPEIDIISVPRRLIVGKRIASPLIQEVVQLIIKPDGAAGHEVLKLGADGQRGPRIPLCPAELVTYCPEERLITALAIYAPDRAQLDRAHDFKITNMDGISPTMYQNAAAVKSKNPNLKVLIALGGWTFSDPGAWQDVFPTMASTPENRATFIKNALGWLSEYGYDGIDFDWEYPGADDRGGSDGDGANYTALLKELRAAIDANGKEYIVTFTSPSSYCLTALRAVTDPKLASGGSTPFTVDPHNLFSNEDYPTDNTDPRFGMVNFGNEANMGGTGPDKTGFGFFLVTGESHAVSKLRRRAGDPEPFTFLDCPENATGRPDDEAQVARVVCLSEDVEGCFRVMERGVEGTVVEMPDNCAPGTFARAISLNVSDNQSIPSYLEGRASSAVFEFTFDYNFVLIRKDTKQTSIRMDYSSRPGVGYSNDLVDSEGVESNDEKRPEDHFYSDLTRQWDSQCTGLNLREGAEEKRFDRSLTTSIFWDTVDKCMVNGEQFSEGIGAYVDGSIKARFEYGFTLILMDWNQATIKDGKLSVSQTHGRLYAKGYTDLTFVIGGVGKLDVSKTTSDSNPAWSHGPKERIDEYSVYATGMKGWATYKPYIQLHYMIGHQKNDSFSAINFSGVLGARVNSSVGPIAAYFPNIEDSNPPSGRKIAEPNMSIPDGNIVYGSDTGTTGLIALACYVTLGLDLEFSVTAGLEDYHFNGPDMSIRFENSVFFENDATSGKGTCVNYNVENSETVVVDNSRPVSCQEEDLTNAAVAPQWTLPTKTTLTSLSVILATNNWMAIGLATSLTKETYQLEKATEMSITIWISEYRAKRQKDIRR
ncbi:hypothetical protein V494_02182 [Pseudogymnoascus sp. VKM F-4513 (FW-928)]|nr:hypothetical protein V494_02182 [Pseudogymnoascus sp. VKM F-4513 (FW-928)]